MMSMMSMMSMLKLILLSSSLLLLLSLSSSSSSVLDELKSIQRVIDSEPDFCYPAHSGSKAAYLGRRYNQLLSSHNISSSSLQTLVYPFCLVTTELGNRLGNYFNEIACAEVSGLHFVAVQRHWDTISAIKGLNMKLDTTNDNNAHTNITADSNNGNNGNKHRKANGVDLHRLAFLNALPSVLVHPNPSDEKTARAKIETECKCSRYCWHDRDAPWVKKLDSIRLYIRRAVSAYLDTFQADYGTTVDPETDFTNAQSGTFLPLIPDAAIQYRCGDNIGFSYMYGVLPFTAFPSRIPQNGTKFIYVLSDHPTRAKHSPYSSRCQIILKSLFDYLVVHYPRATIVVKRGGDLFLDYARLTLANVTICSASSFCMWPALANTGQVHFPLTVIAAGADSIELAPNLTTNFQWIVEPKIISDFRKLRPWNKIIDILEGKMEMVE